MRSEFDAHQALMHAAQTRMHQALKPAPIRAPRVTEQRKQRGFIARLFGK